MKVLIVVDNLEIGGVAKIALQLCESIYKKYDVYFDYITYDKPSREQINILNENHSKIFVIDRVSNSSPIRYVNDIRRIIRTNGPYIAIHSHTGYFIWLASFAGKLEGIKNRIGHGHGSQGVDGKKGIVYKIILKLGRRLNIYFCTKMFACSKDAGKFNFGCKYTFLPNYSSKEKIKEAIQESKDYFKEFGIDNSKIIIGFMGYVGGVKKPEFLIKMALYLKKKGIKNYYFIIAGNGEKAETLNDLIDKNDLSEYIKLIGYRNDNFAMVHWYDILLVPSIYEGMSLSIIEAQMLGTYVISSKGVPKTNDIGVRLFFQSDSYNESEWLELIEKCDFGNIKPFSKRMEQLKQIGYDEDTIINNVYESYKLY